MKRPEEVNLLRQKINLWLPGARGRAIDGEWLLNVCGIHPLGRMKSFWNQMWVIVTQHCKCTRCHWTVHFKMVYFMWSSPQCKKKKKGIGFEEHLKIFPAYLTLPNIAIKFIPDSSKTFPMTIRHCLYCSKFIEIKITFDIFKDM